MAGFGGYGETESIDTPRADRMREVRVLPAQPYMPPEPQKTAEVNIGSEYTEKGRLRPCVYVQCVQSRHWVGPIWGDEERSVKRALATLGEQCSCGGGWHNEVERRVDQSPGNSFQMAPVEAEGAAARNWSQLMLCGK